MKKYLALLIVSFIVLTSMSDCKKDIDDELLTLSTVSVQLDGKTYKSSGRYIPGLSRKAPFSSEIRHWDVDSIAFEFEPHTWTIDNEEVKFKIVLHICSVREFEFNKWYPLNDGCNANYVKWVDGKTYYNMADGMLRLTGAEELENNSIPRYSGEFWFDAVNENDLEDVITARNGEFRIQPLERDYR